jgi:hypothetical protein
LADDLRATWAFADFPEEEEEEEEEEEVGGSSRS